MNLRQSSLLAGLAILVAGPVVADDTAPPDGRIGYVMTNLFWSVYQTDDAKEECPRGFNDGPREQFAKLYPDHEGMTVEQTQLRQEIETWHPTDEPDGFEFLQVEGEFGFGLNLDGEVGENDFTHPETGEEGIDNEVYRAVGCIIGFRGPDGVEYIFQDKAIIDERYNRMMIELTGVDQGGLLSSANATPPSFSVIVTWSSKTIASKLANPDPSGAELRAMVMFAASTRGPETREL